jgi:ABC-type multidrug transport system fused ATPase/permease subunit
VFKYLSPLWDYLTWHRKRQLCLLLFVMILSSIAEVVSIGVVLPFLGALSAPDTLMNTTLGKKFFTVLNINNPNDLLFPLTGFFIVAVIISALMRILLLAFQTRLGVAIGSDLSNEIFERTLYQPYQVHLSRSSSEIISAISSKVNLVIYTTIIPLMTIASSTLILAAIILALILIEPLGALLAFSGFGLIYLLIIFITKKQIAINGEKISKSSNQIVKALQEGLGGIREILIDGTQKIYCLAYRKADFSVRRAQAMNQILSGSPRFFVEALGICFITIIAYNISKRESGISNLIPILGALALGAQRVLPVMQQLYSSWSSLRAGKAALNDVFQLIKQPMPYYFNKSSSDSINFENSIQLNNVSFSYAREGPKILNNINLKIKKGSCIGIFGTTGGGKSTLLDIIIGLLMPTTGRLEIDNVSIDMNNYRAWQSIISHVPQWIYLADSSIAENIAFGIPFEMIDMDRVRDAAKKAQIAEVIESWTDKYMTTVGERGVRLSGGQRQRIGIARALYKNKAILILDEATSALDTQTEIEVMNTINSSIKDKTIIIVTHRLSTLKFCETAYEITNGEIKNRGKLLHMSENQAQFL